MITIKQEISEKRISDLLCSALEGGSNYWYMVEEIISPKSWDANFCLCGPGQEHFYSDYPVNVGGALIISIKDPENAEEKKARYTLDKSAIERGLQIMAKNFGGHFGDFMAEQDDAETGDVFLQCCLFGKLIYG